LHWFQRGEEEACDAFEEQAIIHGNNSFFFATHGLLKYQFFCQSCENLERTGVLDDYQVFKRL